MKARFAYKDKQQLLKTYIGRNSSWHVCSSTNPVPYLAEGQVVNGTLLRPQPSYQKMDGKGL